MILFIYGIVCALGGVLMDVQTVTQFISNLGFPIACCIYLAYSNEKLRTTIEENTKTIDGLKTLFSIYFKKDGVNDGRGNGNGEFYR